jgi:hypothetical protein
MEVLVSLILIAVTLAGFVNIFFGAKSWLAHRRHMMTGVQLGRVFLDPLQMDVAFIEKSPGAQNGWDQVNNTLTLGTRSSAAQNIAGKPFTPSYSITSVAGTNLRRARLTVNWTEP